MSIYNSERKYIVLTGNTPSGGLDSLGCNSGSPLSFQCNDPKCTIHCVKTHGWGGMSRYRETIIYGPDSELVSSTSVVTAFKEIVNATISVDGKWIKNPSEIFLFIQDSLHALTYVGMKIQARPVPTKVRQLRAEKQQVLAEKKTVVQSMSKLMTYAKGVTMCGYNVSELYRFVSELKGFYSSTVMKNVWDVDVLPCIPMHHFYCHPLLAAVHIRKTVADYTIQRLVGENKLHKIYEAGRAVKLFPALYGGADYDSRYVGVVF